MIMVTVYPLMVLFRCFSIFWLAHFSVLFYDTLNNRLFYQQRCINCIQIPGALARETLGRCGLISPYMDSGRSHFLIINCIQLWNIALSNCVSLIFLKNQQINFSLFPETILQNKKKSHIFYIMESQCCLWLVFQTGSAFIWYYESINSLVWICHCPS